MAYVKDGFSVQVQKERQIPCAPPITYTPKHVITAKPNHYNIKTHFKI